MGARRLADIIGRRDLLIPSSAAVHPAARKIDLGILSRGYSDGRPGRCLAARNDNPAVSMNSRLVDDLLPYIEKGESVEREYAIRNVDRSIPVRLNYYIAIRYKDAGLPPDTIRITFRGTAGQSFGAFNHKGLTLTLIGDANDYTGKGMFGGKIVIKPADLEKPHRHVIAGNTVLYGATGGRFFAAGRAGERFAVRNSGATAVIEGAGHHLCEYMTAGTVLVLGEAGYNVGAGMSGGVIVVYDERDTLKSKINSSYVHAIGIEDKDEISGLRSLLEEHYRHTESRNAGEILDAFEERVRHFKKVIPRIAQAE
jgi:glutamate synthase (NADPH/NADH) large chain